ncbi:hypothetical protein V2I01_26565 [Micromonospora sp. BRA006-A]|nr:hypothetical protein [Micromonospora sp. BRA006-A]
MEQAKARNPAIKLAALPWGAPGWIGNGNFMSQGMINYFVDWLGARGRTSPWTTSPPPRTRSGPTPTGPSACARR